MGRKPVNLETGITKVSYEARGQTIHKYRVRIYYGRKGESLGYYHDLASARAALKDANKRIKDGKFIPPTELRRRALREQQGYAEQAVKVSDFAATWLGSLGLGANPRSAGTITSYASTLNKHIIPALGDRYLIEVNQHAVDKLIAQVRKDSGEGAARNVAQALKSLYYYAIKTGAGGLSELPFKLKTDKSEKRADSDIPTPSEVTKIASQMRPELRLAPMLAATCALRPGETLGLQRQDFIRLDSDTPTLRVQRTWNQKARPSGYTPPKGGRSREVIIPRFMVPQIQQHLEAFVAESPEAPLFMSPVNASKPIGGTAYRREWGRAIEAAESPRYVLHSLRHLGLTLLVLAGATRAEVMARGGHTDSDAADRYQHQLRGREKELISAFSEVWEQGK